MIANPLSPDIEEEVKNSIMKNRKIILDAVKEGLNKLDEFEEGYDEKLDEKKKDNVDKLSDMEEDCDEKLDEENEDNVDKLTNSEDKDAENKNTELPNSIQTEKFLNEKCITLNESDQMEDENPNKKSSEKSDGHEGENQKKKSKKKTQQEIDQAFTDFEKVMEKNTLLKDLDQSRKVNIYLNALSISEKGRDVILKRKISERNVNNYNELFHSVWQANTDIQLGLDTHAVISYISDYVTKSDQGLTKLLTAALNEKKNCSRFEQLNHVKRVYFFNKQTCVSEAAYRLIPGLNLKDSNIKTMFLTSGFPENRRQYFRQIPEDEKQDEGIEIEGREGKFQTSMSKIELYSARPKDTNSKYSKGRLENLCFAEFCMNYDKVAEKDTPKQKFKYEELYQKKNGEIVSALIDETVKCDRNAKLVCGIGYEPMLKDFEIEGGLPKYFFFVKGRCFIFFMHLSICYFVQICL